MANSSVGVYNINLFQDAITASYVVLYGVSQILRSCKSKSNTSFNFSFIRYSNQVSKSEDPPYLLVEQP